MAFLFCRLQLRIQQKLNEPSIRSKVNVVWQEFVVDLWQRHLPHLREELYGEGVYVFIGRYGFQEEHGEEVSSEVMAGLLEKAADHEAEQNWNAGNSESSSSPESSLSGNVALQSFIDEGESQQLLNFGAVGPESIASRSLHCKCFMFGVLCFNVV